MAEPGAGAELVLGPRAAASDAFAPYGRVVAVGDRVRLGGKGAVLLALDAPDSTRTRVRNLVRFPEARRLLLAVGESPVAVVVAGFGDRPSPAPEAFLVPGGTGVLLHAGVWHAGPLALGRGAVLEAVEAPGVADRMDQASVTEAFGVEALRVAADPAAPARAAVSPGTEATSRRTVP